MRPVCKPEVGVGTGSEPACAQRSTWTSQWGTPPTHCHHGRITVAPQAWRGLVTTRCSLQDSFPCGKTSLW